MKVNKRAINDLNLDFSNLQDNKIKDDLNQIIKTNENFFFKKIF